MIGEDGTFLPLFFHDPADDGLVHLTSDRPDGPTAGTHRFEPLEFLARLLSHVPRKNEIYVRYYGAYSVRRRAAWRKSGIRARPATDTVGHDAPALA